MNSWNFSLKTSLYLHWFQCTILIFTTVQYSYKGVGMMRLPSNSDLDQKTDNGNGPRKSILSFSPFFWGGCCKQWEYSRMKHCDPALEVFVLFLFFICFVVVKVDVSFFNFGLLLVIIAFVSKKSSFLKSCNTIFWH